ncbi:MAG TPA: phosphoadenylyl-sulfate reductase [Candidatus Binatia bacterium]|nr:phosphoadenylyl-sulfate reductase [Candidatus Binatia bacterium]
MSQAAGTTVDFEFDVEALDLDSLNAVLERKSAEERIGWALDELRPHIILSSSFGAQAAVCLHMCTLQWPEIPVVVTDTGYLFPETYQFIDELTERLKLNLKVYRAEISAAWQEARHGKLWEQGVEGIEQYNKMNKVEPMQRALDDLGAKGWIVGLRRSQSSTRKNLSVLGVQNGYLKVHPIVDWNDKRVFDYMQEHDLPYHPLWEQGYISIGDTHTSHRLVDGVTEEETRFFGLKRECGLHEPFKGDGDK